MDKTKKICSKCLEEKELSFFNKSKTSKFGVRGDCKSCQSKYNINYTIENKEVLKAKSKNYRKNNPDYFINYREKNKEKHKLYISNRLKNDKLFKLSINIRNLIKISLKRNGFSKNSKTHEILGCTYEEFKQHLESKFEPWMTWDNYGLYNGEPNYGWDIDHIIPLSISNEEKELIKLNHYLNLQPLCSKINRDLKKANLY